MKHRSAGEAIALDGLAIGPGSPPFIIAELSGNHNGSLKKALELVEAAAQAGAHGFKLQTYTAATMTLDLAEGEFHVGDRSNPWYGYSLYQLYEEAHTPWEWHPHIFERARALGMVPFSSPFDDTAVDFLESLNVALYKIASFELTDIPLLKKVATTGKPIIMSTGMASVDEIQEAVCTIREGGVDEIVLLKCTSTYPASPLDANLKTLPDMHRNTGCLVGLSDHTLGIGCSVASIALGACVIERHLTAERSAGGVDAAFSLEPNEFAQLVREATAAWEGLGTVRYRGTDSEQKSKQYRRSVYICDDTRAGETLTKKNVRVIRPGLGLEPKHYESILGRTLKVDARKGTPLSWDMI